MRFTASKKNWLRKSRLYLVLDAAVNDYGELLRIGLQAVKAGVDLLQLRDKHGAAKDIARLASKLIARMNPRVPLMINDRVDVALACGADGVHLGQDDLSIKLARKILGRGAIIGCSCQTLAQARQAREDGADYIGFGSVFKTQTKPQRAAMDLKLLQRVIHEFDFPVFVIGGIDTGNIGRLRVLGVDKIAVTRAISRAKNIGEAVRILKD